MWSAAEEGVDPMKCLDGFLAPVMIVSLAMVVRAQDAPPLPAPLPSATPGAPNPGADLSARDPERLERSLAAWGDAKQRCGGNYAYVVRFTSAFGFGHATTVTVRGNRVTERKFERWGRPEPGKPPGAPSPEWVETGAEIGSHAEPSAAPAKTIDELYAIAKTVVDNPLAPHQVRSLAIDGRGLLQACTIRDTRIADDAPTSGVPPFEMTLAAE
jgi:hypothetical protein